MCRWMAWLGQPVLIEELLFKTDYPLWLWNTMSGVCNDEMVSRSWAFHAPL